MPNLSFLKEDDYLKDKLQIPADVQGDREAKRMALLQQEKATNPDDPAIAQEIKNNRPIHPPADASKPDLSFLDQDEPVQPTKASSEPNLSFLDQDEPVDPSPSMHDQIAQGLQDGLSHMPGAGFGDKLASAGMDLGRALVNDPSTAYDAIGQTVLGTPGAVTTPIEQINKFITHPIDSTLEYAKTQHLSTPVTDKYVNPAWKQLIIGDAPGSSTNEEQYLDPERRKQVNPQGVKAVEDLLNVPVTGMGEEVVRAGHLEGSKAEPMVRRLTEDLTGAALILGPVAHGAAAGKAPVTPRTAEDAVGSKGTSFSVSDVTGIVKGLGEAIDSDMPNRERFQPRPDQTRQAAIDEQLSAIDALRTAQERTDAHEVGGLSEQYQHHVGNVLDLLADSTEHSPDVTEVAKAYSRLINQTGLDLVPLKGPEELGKGTAGKYYPNDSVAIAGGGRDPAARAQTFLHEVTHALTSNVIERYLKDPTWFDDPARQEMGRRVADFDAIFKEAREAYRKEHGFDPVERANDIGERRKTGDMTADESSWLGGEGYGWTDLHEFASEIMADPKFRDALGKLKRPADLSSRSAANPRRVYSFWEPVKQAFIRMLTPGSGYKGTYLETAIEHLTGLADTVDARQRTNVTSGMPSVRGGKRATEIADAVAKRQASPLEGATGDLARWISGQLREAGGDFNMFRDMTSTALNHPDWFKFMDEYAPKIWDNADQFIKSHGEYDPYAGLHPELRRHIIETGGADEFFKRLGINTEVEGERQALPSKEDIGLVAGVVGGNVLTDRGNAAHAAMGNTVGAKIQKWFLDQGGMYRNVASILYSRIIEHYQDFNKLSYDDKKGFMNGYAAMDTAGYRQRLKLEGRQWASTEMLKELGFSDAQIKAYEGVTKGLDITHSLLDSIQRLTTGMPLERIPGYMPHFFDGAYKVMVKKIDKQGQGGIVRVKGFNTRGQALAFVKELERGDHDLAGDKYRFRAEVNTDTGKPFWVTKFEDISNSIAGQMQEHLNAYKNEQALDPSIKQVLDGIDAKSALGFNKHLMDRSGVLGYRGEFGAKEAHTPRAYWDNGKLFRIFQDYTKHATEFYKNSLFIDRVASRVLGEYPTDMTGRRYYGNVVSKLDNLKRYLWEYTYNLTGENLNHFSMVDKLFRGIALYTGRNPHAVKSFVRELRNFYSQYQLKMNLRNKAANFLQPGLVIGMLDWVAGTLSPHMKNVPSGMGSFVRTMLRDRKDPEMQGHVQWAIDQHILDPQLDLELRSERNLFGEKIHQLHEMTYGSWDARIEGFGRRVSFITAMDFFRKVFPNDPMAARRAAANIMQMTMVNYDRSARPLMFQNFGLTGEAISPFAVFRNAWYGNMTLMLREMAKNPKNIQAYRGFLMTQVVYLGTAGLSGMAFYQEVNWLIKQWNTLFPGSPMMTLEEMQLKAKVPDLVGFGSIGALTKLIPGLEEGINIGPNTGAVSMSDFTSFPLYKFLTEDVGNIAIAARAGLHKLGAPVKAVTNEELYTSLRAVAPPAPFVRSWPERMLKGEGQPSVAWKSNASEAEVDRTPSGQRVYDLSASPSIEESKRVTAEKFVSRMTKLQEDNLKVYVKAAADALDGKPSQYSYEEARAKALSDGTEGDAFIQLVQQEQEKRFTPVRTRDARKNTAQGAQSRYWRSLMGY